MILYLFGLTAVCLAAGSAFFCKYAVESQVLIGTHWAEGLAPTELGWSWKEARKKKMFGIPPYPGWKNAPQEVALWPKDVPTLFNETVASSIKRFGQNRSLEKATSGFLSSIPCSSCILHNSGPSVEQFDGTERGRGHNDLRISRFPVDDSIPQ